MEKPIRPFKDFHGNVDAFLEHCSKIDPEQISNDDVMLNHEELVDTIAEEWHVSKEEADRIAMEVKLEIVKDTTKELAAEGILEVDGYDEDGECIYKLTEKGKEYAKQIKKQHGIP
jgi:Mn-dependent DtxR family transcriptional regulator